MTHILGLRALADFIAKSNTFDQSNGFSCTLGHAFRLAGQPTYTSSETSADHLYNRAGSLLGITPSEAADIWSGNYPNRSAYELRTTQVVAVEYLLQLADKYEPASPINAKPMAAPSPMEAQPMPLVVLDRELVPA